MALQSIFYKNLILSILFSYFSFLNASQACTVIKTQSIEKGIADAQLIVIGNVELRKEGNKEVKFLRVLKKWTPALDEVRLKQTFTGDCSAPAVDVGELYLFVNSYSILSDSDVKDGISEFTSNYVPLNRANSYMEILSNLPVSDERVNPAWEYCSYDDECIRLNISCKEDVFVNKKFKEKMTQYLQSRSSQKCESSNSLKKSRCLNNFCVEMQK